MKVSYDHFYCMTFIVFALTRECYFPRLFFNNGLKVLIHVCRGRVVSIAWNACTLFQLFWLILGDLGRCIWVKKMARENLEGKNNAGFQVNFPPFSFLVIPLSARFHICADRIQFILLPNVTLTVFFK